MIVPSTSIDVAFDRDGDAGNRHSTLQALVLKPAEPHVEGLPGDPSIRQV